jgi:prepilin-type N-terminal cleavage/methylation domain-containing protein
MIVAGDPKRSVLPGLPGAGATRGFTLIEVVVVMLIATILFAVINASFTEWLRNSRIRSQAESILSGLQMARAEAVKRNRFVRFQFVRRNEGAATDEARLAGCTLSNQSNLWIVSHGDPSNATTDTIGWPNEPPNPDVYPADAKDNCARDITMIQARYILNPPAGPDTDPGNNPIILARNVPEGRAAQDAAGQTEVRTQILMGNAVAAFPPPLLNEAVPPAVANVVCFDNLGRLGWLDTAAPPGNCVATHRPGTDFPAVATIDVMFRRAPDNSEIPGAVCRDLDNPDATLRRDGLTCLRIVVPASGEPRLCDPQLRAASNPRDPRLCR